MAKYVNKTKVNPSSCIMYMKIGKNEITLKNSPKMSDSLISFSMTETALDTASDIVFTLYDQTALALEYELLRGFNDIQYRFGMDEKSLCPMRHCTAKDYDIDFQASGVVLTINAIAGKTPDPSEKPKVYKGNTSSIVSQIAKDLGYVSVVTTTNDEEKEYTTDGKDGLACIKELATSATDAKGNTPYTSYLKDKNGKTYLYFEPLKKENVDAFQSYEYTMGQDHESIISFKPEYSGLLYHQLGQGNNTTLPSEATGGTATVDNGETTTSTTQETVDTKSTNQLGFLAPSIDEWSNRIIKPYENKTNFKRYIGSSSYNVNQLSKIADYMFCRSAALAPTAQLTLRGDAKIDPQSFVVMVVLTFDGLFHHSSGLYQVLEVSHDIDRGAFTTTLNLMKRAMYIDEKGKIELLDISSAIVSDKMKAPVDSNSGTTSSDSNGTSVNNGTDKIENGVVLSASSATVRKYADKYVGLPYIWGGQGSNKKGYDCSGFCSEVLYDMGYKRIGTTASFINAGETIPWDKSKILPGDLLVYRKNGRGHVTMIVDTNTEVHAPKPGDVIKYADIQYHWDYIQKMGGSIRRIIGNEQYLR